MISIAGILCIFGLFAVCRKIYSAYFGPLSNIPGPKWNAFSNWPYLLAMARGEEVNHVNELHKQYGPVVRVAPDLIAVIGNANVWKQIYGFPNKGCAPFEKDFVFYDKPVNGTPGPITASGEAHSRQRKLLAPAFSDQALKRYETRLKSWMMSLGAKLAEQTRVIGEVDMVKILNCATFDIMSDLTFRESLHMLDNGEYSPWVELIFGSLKLGTQLRAIRYLVKSSQVVLSYLMRHMPSMREHHQYITSRVSKRRNIQPHDADVWSQITENESNATGMLSLEELYSIANELMIAGTETTASALSGVLYYLLRNRHWLERLTGELRQQYGDNIESLTLASLQSQRTLNAVLQEGLRMYPPLPTGLPRHVPVNGAEIEGYIIPHGARVAIYHIPTYRHNTNFRHPYDFRPERWLGDTKFENDLLDAMEPFSVGPRNCIGKNFAWHEMRLLLATVLLRFDMELACVSEDWAEQKVYIVWEKKPLMCKLRQWSY